MRAIITQILILLLISGCIPQKEVLTESDYSFDGTFRNYETYAFMDNFYEEGEINRDLGPVFEQLITRKFESQGYSKNSNEPDLLINYKYYPKGATIMAAEQPGLNYWVKKASNEDGYDLHSTKLKEGTVIITFYDHHRGIQVWKGYASGYLRDREPDLAFMRLTVNQILDQYQILANGYTTSIR